MSGIKTEIRTITPQQAKSLLRKGAVNRRLRERTVAAYAADMAAGLWLMTGEPIIISDQGDLLDGQHRLQAVSIAGVPVKFLVTTGVDKSAQSAMDQGAGRTISDSARMLGVNNAGWSTSVARWLYLVPVPGPDMETALKQKAPSQILLAFLLEPKNRDIEDGASAYSGLRTNIPGSPTAIIYCWVLFHRLNPGDNIMFWAAMNQMQFKDLNDPRKAALRALQGIVRDYGHDKRAGMATISVLTRAWNMWRSGEQVQVIRLSSASGKIISAQEPK